MDDDELIAMICMLVSQIVVILVEIIFEKPRQVLTTYFIYPFLSLISITNLISFGGRLKRCNRRSAPTPYGPIYHLGVQAHPPMCVYINRFGITTSLCFNISGGLLPPPPQKRTRTRANILSLSLFSYATCLRNNKCYVFIDICL